MSLRSRTGKVLVLGAGEQVQPALDALIPFFSKHL